MLHGPLVGWSCYEKMELNVLEIRKQQMAITGAFVVDENDELVEVAAADAVGNDVVAVDGENAVDGEIVDDVLVVGDDAVADNAVVDDDEAVVADAAIDVVAVVVSEPIVAEHEKQPRQKLT